MGPPTATPVEVGPYVVTDVVKGRTGLYSLTVQTPDGTRLRIVMAGGALSIERVRIAADAVGMLWERKIGATPLAEGH